MKKLLLIPLLFAVVGASPFRVTKYYNTIGEARSNNPVDIHDVVMIPQERVGGFFFITNAPSMAIDGGITFRNLYNTNYVLKRVLEGKTINATWFGLSPTASAATNTLAIQTAANYCSNNLGTLYIPEGVYNVNTGLWIRCNTRATKAVLNYTNRSREDGWAITIGNSNVSPISIGYNIELPELNFVEDDRTNGPAYTNLIGYRSICLFDSKIHVPKIFYAGTALQIANTYVPGTAYDDLTPGYFNQYTIGHLLGTGIGIHCAGRANGNRFSGGKYESPSYNVNPDGSKFRYTNSIGILLTHANGNTFDSIVLEGETHEWMIYSTNSSWNTFLNLRYEATAGGVALTNCRAAFYTSAGSYESGMGNQILGGYYAGFLQIEGNGVVGINSLTGGRGLELMDAAWAYGQPSIRAMNVWGSYAPVMLVHDQAFRLPYNHPRAASNDWAFELNARETKWRYGTNYPWLLSESTSDRLRLSDGANESIIPYVNGTTNDLTYNATNGAGYTRSYGPIGYLTNLVTTYTHHYNNIYQNVAGSPIYKTNYVYDDSVSTNYFWTNIWTIPDENAGIIYFHSEAHDEYFNKFVWDRREPGSFLKAGGFSVGTTPNLNAPFTGYAEENGFYDFTVANVAITTNYPYAAAGFRIWASAKDGSGEGSLRLFGSNYVLSSNPDYRKKVVLDADANTRGIRIQTVGTNSVELAAGSYGNTMFLRYNQIFMPSLIGNKTLLSLDEDDTVVNTFVDLPFYRYEYLIDMIRVTNASNPALVLTNVFRAGNIGMAINTNHFSTNFTLAYFTNVFGDVNMGVTNFITNITAVNLLELRTNALVSLLNPSTTHFTNNSGEFQLNTNYSLLRFVGYNTDQLTNSAETLALKVLSATNLNYSTNSFTNNSGQLALYSVYGCLSTSSNTQTHTFAGAGTNYPFTIFTNAQSSGVLVGCTFETNGIKVPVAGYYSFNAQLSFTGGNGDVIEFELCKNAAAFPTRFITESKVAAAGAIESVSVCGIALLAAGDIVSIGIENETDTDAVTCKYAQLVVQKLP